MAAARGGGAWDAEVPAYTGLMTRVRQDARDRLAQSVRALGADGVVVSAMTLRVRSDPCHARAAATDHFAEAVTTGSAVARFAGRDEATPPPSRTVVHLDGDPGAAGRSGP